MGRWGDGEMGRWGDGEMGKWGDGEMGEILIKYLLKLYKPKSYLLNYTFLTTDIIIKIIF
ncbi:MAG: hypothetical protein F6K55_33245 [Moorea sp. SIO4A3]|nr:hypothetical protein [Moorena sp. SIO4A3]